MVRATSAQIAGASGTAQGLCPGTQTEENEKNYSKPPNCSKKKKKKRCKMPMWSQVKPWLSVGALLVLVLATETGALGAAPERSGLP